MIARVWWWLVVGRCAGVVHIVHVVVDDVGWGNVGFHGNSEVETPTLDGLARSGLELERLYAHKFCSPSRCALQTGFAPIHVNVENVDPSVRNPSDPEGGYQGIPVSMVGIGEKLREKGYRTHAVGKWDVGMATNKHHPRHRGFESWLGYWHHSNDYWSYEEGSCGSTSMRDLWEYNATHDGPAVREGYEDEVLRAEAVRLVQMHDPREPLFLLWAPHLTHAPLEVPREVERLFLSIDDVERRRMAAMVSLLDTEIGTLVAALQPSLWKDTLLVVHSDNGGEIIFAGSCGGSNWPLRGGKFSNFEGGIRVVGLVNGGALGRRGKFDGLVGVWDWYATYCAIAGADPGNATRDSTNLWPVLRMGGDAPRTELVIGDSSALGYNAQGQTLVGGLLWRNGTALYKLLLGAANKRYLIDQDVRAGPLFPNRSALAPQLYFRRCGRTAETGCLFDVIRDETEDNNIAPQRPDIFYAMLRRASEFRLYSPNRGDEDPMACARARAYGNYWGPWINLI
ncbi:hypothetical protein CTAYLR_003776 [Chrysophaeum taylorii]|uniref:Sulfatase N-terminal domain-containing protein n=1 Tax=Chrysophaeum taylorii TaxID=2483200 RepID=A0AAD7XIF7_9STRA|nr:hypothetical protein CTAYLR_003776 [Chrysophaeum taylorii]